MRVLVAAIAVWASAAGAQAQNAPIPPSGDPITTGPGSYGWPGTTTATNPLLGGGLPPTEVVPAPFVVPPQQVAPGQPGVMRPTPILETPPSVFAPNGSCQPGADQFSTPNGLPPIPGSLEDQFNHELAARRAFRYCLYDGTRITGFPNTLLWTPPFAELRAPRMSIPITTFNNYVNTYTIDPSIGGTLGLVRYEPRGLDAAFQLDLFAVVHTRLSPDDLIATDYRFGFPLTFRRGDWQGRLAYEHTSAHLGDEFQRNTNRGVINFARNEIVAGLGRFLFDQQLRIYETVSYAFTSDLNPDTPKWRFDVGFQWVSPYSTGFNAHPFVAGHAEFPGVNRFNVNITGQAGVLFANPLSRLSMLRFYGQYYEGHSQFGQFYFEREKYFAAVMSADF